MDNKLMEKLSSRSKGTEKEFLGDLAKVLAESKERLSKYRGADRTEIKDLRSALADALFGCAALILKKPDGSCDLTEKEMQAIAS